MYQSVDIVVRSDAFPYAWPSVMIPPFLLASLVRLLLMLSSCGVARTVFGHGLKGKNPLAAAHEHLLPRALRSRLRQRKDLQDALRLCMRGQQLRCSGLPSGPAAGASAGAAQPARTTVNFDIAWRFSRGFEPRSAQCTYEQNANYG